MRWRTETKTSSSVVTVSLSNSGISEVCEVAETAKAVALKTPEKQLGLEETTVPNEDRRMDIHNSVECSEPSHPGG